MKSPTSVHLDVPQRLDRAMTDAEPPPSEHALDISVGRSLHTQTPDRALFLVTAGNGGQSPQLSMGSLVSTSAIRLYALSARPHLHC